MIEKKIDFLESFFSFGLVIRANLDTIQDIKEYISSYSGDITIVFQKISTNKLWIKEGDNE